MPVNIKHNGSNVVLNHHMNDKQKKLLHIWEQQNHTAQMDGVCKRKARLVAAIDPLHLTFTKVTHKPNPRELERMYFNAEFSS